MARVSHDPYGDFVVRVMNAARVAIGQGDHMSHDELAIVEATRAMLVKLDPNAINASRANIRIYLNP